MRVSLIELLLALSLHVGARATGGGGMGGGMGGMGGGMMGVAWVVALRRAIDCCWSWKITRCNGTVPEGDAPFWLVKGKAQSEAIEKCERS